MSWGERSCVHYGSCQIKATPSTCDVDCPKYKWNGKEPDSTSTKKKIFKGNLQELKKKRPSKTFKRIQKDIRARNHKELSPAVLPIVGRNQSCPCGSGKKFKKCCGRTLAKQREKLGRRHGRIENTFGKEETK